MKKQSKPIERILLWERKTDNYSGCLDAFVADNGDLEMSGFHAGDGVKDFFNREDYEYSVTVPKEYKNTVLLWLVKEKFDNDLDFKKWLDKKAIPNELDVWM